jgi:acetylornithine deacetylase/succinyl-diaminopimelate desuccinylase-like protein
MHRSPRSVVVALFVAAALSACGPGGRRRDPSAAKNATPPHIVRLDAEIAGLRDAVVPANVEASIAQLVAFRTRNSCSKPDGKTGIAAARAFILEKLAQNLGMQTALDPFSIDACGEPTELGNVVGWLPGKDPRRLIVVGGHYDSRSTERNDGTVAAPGANDSGSQTAVLLEVARVMAGHPYDATVVFVAFAAEEQGLLGSKAFVAHLATRFPGARVEAMLNCDIVGGDVTANDAGKLQQFRLYSPGTPREQGKAKDGTTDDTSPARGLMRFVGEWGARYVPSMTMVPKLREDRVGRGGDHIPFIDAGLPAVRFIETDETLAHQHSQEDVLANLTPAYAARIAQVVATVAASLARAPSPPRGLSAATTATGKRLLQWIPSPSGADAYVVAIRKTTDHLYRLRLDVLPGATTFALDETALGLAAAPYWVSVAAIDRDGHESLFAYPELRCDQGKCQAPADAADVTTGIKK